VLAVALNTAAHAEGWSVHLQGYPLAPPTFLAVNKTAQQLYVFEHKSPLRLAERYICTTGEGLGDKVSEGDLRTPEGVYFLERRLDGLDFDLYGSLAYTLNFPNPIDRLKGKTGSGIWIHGRGHSIAPRETKGCVAMNLDDLHKLERHIAPGLPVLITSDLDWNEASGNDDVSQQLARRVQDWANAWQSRSKDFFSYYDKQKFALSSNTSFDAFAGHKQGIFSSMPWIQVAVNDVRVVPGPDYWVTYFGQYYRSPSLTSEGIKRLYWQRDENGVLRIVGDEWVMENLGLETQYVRQVDADLRKLVEDWRVAWEKADLNHYLAVYAPDADQGGRKGLDSIREHKKDLWPKQKPRKVILEDLQVELDPNGAKVSFVQRYEASGGFSDQGRKTLVFQPRADGWKILTEEWRAM